MFTQELLFNLPADKAYSALLANFQSNAPLEKFRVVRSAGPSCIEAEFGYSFLESLKSDTKPFIGAARVTITPHGDKSQVLIDYSFGKLLVAWFPVYLALGLLFYSFYKTNIWIGVFFLAYLLNMGVSITRFRNKFQGEVLGYLKAVENGCQVNVG